MVFGSTSRASYLLHCAGSQAVRLDPQLVQTGVHLLEQRRQDSRLGLVEGQEEAQVAAMLPRESNTGNHLLDRGEEEEGPSEKVTLGNLDHFKHVDKG